MDTARPSATATYPQEGRTIQTGSATVTHKLDSAATGGSAAIVEITLQPGTAAAPMHRHEREDEIVYVLEGVVEVQVGETLVTGEQGAYVFMPRGVFHTFWNESEQPATAQLIATPGGFEAWLDELATLIPKNGMPDMAEIATRAADFGLTFDFGSVEALARRGVNLI